MGLDMYLTARRSLYRDGDKAIAETIGQLDISTHGMRVTGVECEAMYWRKANAIHRWFVENVQDGIDDCREHMMEPEQLNELVDACKEALAHRDKAADVLPPTGGFFFGSTDLDDWYWDSLQTTVDGLTKVLENPELLKWDFYYQSSW
jgi:hypothetical protein